MTRQMRLFLSSAMMVLMTLGVAIAPVAAQETMTKPEVVKQVSTAVVTVLNLSAGRGPYNVASAQPQGAGTGFIISKDGYVVTNWHVVVNGDAFEVVLYDGTTLDAELIGIDARDDIAVVKIDPAAVPAVAVFGDSDQLQVGEDVLAIGSPLGAFSNTVTGGIIGALGRNQLGGGGNTACQDYSNLIQHDAAINHGNSGGPLFNMKGEVIGMNTLGIPVDNQGEPVQGLFFAIPSNTVKVVVDQLIENGQITRPWAGISEYYELAPAMSKQFDIPADYGALIATTAANGPAAQAGLQRNDIILAVDGTPIDENRSFADLMVPYQPGDSVDLTVLRDGRQISIPLVLGEIALDDSQCQLGS